MKIIHIVLGKANPQRMNGVNKVVYQLASRQAAAGKKVAIWGITKDLTINFEERDFETRLFQAQKNPFNISADLEAAIGEQANDVIFHLHGGWIPTFYKVGKTIKENKLTYFLTAHGAYNRIAMKRSFWIKKLYFQLFEKYVIKHASSVHCIGQSEVSGLNGLFSSAKAALLPYGFEANFNQKPGKDEQGKFIIGFVGRLDIYTKGLDLLLDAFKKFREQIPNSELWIVGDSKEKEVLLRSINQKAIGKHTILWGSKFGAEKDQIMEQMDVFAHPSRNEGLPSAVLEACAMGIPCVVSEATNVGQFIANYNAGISVENESADKLFKAIVQLKKSKDSKMWDTISENAKTMVATEFNWASIVQKFDALYQGKYTTHGA